MACGRDHDEQRVAVRLGLRGELGADDAVGAAAIVHDDGLPPRLAQLLRDGARDDVGAAAGRKRHDEAHRPGRIGRLRRGVRDAAELQRQPQPAPGRRRATSALTARHPVVLRDEVQQVRRARRGRDVMDHVIARRQVHDAEVAQVVEQHAAPAPRW